MNLLRITNEKTMQQSMLKEFTIFNIGSSKPTNTTGKNCCSRIVGHFQGSFNRQRGEKRKDRRDKKKIIEKEEEPEFHGSRICNT